MEDVRIPTRRKLLYLAVVVVLLLGIGEAGLRLRAWIKYGTSATGVRDPMLVRDEAAGLWVPTPGYEIKGSKINVKINSLGFRGEEFPRVKAPGTFRIVCLGASTTFGSESSSNATTWPHRLQEKLRAAHPGRPIEVINAAVGGYLSSHNLKNLQHRVLPLDPDLVIFYEANNEIVADTRQLAIRQGLIDPEGRRQPAWTTALGKISLTFDLVYKNLAIFWRSRDGQQKIDKVPADLPNAFIGNLDAMRRLLTDRGVKFLVATFVVKYRRDQDRATQIANADVAFYYMPWMSIDGLLDAMDTYNAAIMDFGRTTGVPVLDDRVSIPPDSRHFIDCMHLLDPGNDLMADRFVRFIQASRLITG